MVRNASLFSQLLQHVSRTEFAALVKEHRAEHGSKGFTCWTQCVAIYRDRWKIELFSKALKQNLKIKTFIGTSENALRIQIWTALIALLLFRWLHHRSKARWSFSTLVSMLRLNLLTYRDLKEWLDDPYRTPPDTSPPKQFILDLAGFGQRDR